MINKFIDWLKKQVGSIYVWGAQGEVGFNEEWIKKCETSESNAKRAIAFFNKQLNKGMLDVAAYDCSGLIVRFFLDNDIVQSDMSARGLFSFCKEIKQQDLRAGDLVFRHNGDKIHHVGVYIG
ncbi:MAG: C40 family peptidase, partial [Clostridiales bacterium]|nr:C40 family peptidase [Clostridiales bacterium]